MVGLNNGIKDVRLLKIKRLQNRLFAIAVTYDSFHVPRPVSVVNYFKNHVVKLIQITVVIRYITGQVWVYLERVNVKSQYYVRERS